MKEEVFRLFKEEAGRGPLTSCVRKDPIRLTAMRRDRERARPELYSPHAPQRT